MQKRIFALCSVLFLLVINCQGQTAENIVATFHDSLAIITYDLVGVKGGSTEELYLVEIYSSHNNFSSPLQRVSGAAGRNIKSGKGKAVTWRLAEEAGGYNGKLSFRIKVMIGFRPLDFIVPRGGYVKRGRPAIIEWTGGLRTGQASSEKQLELYRKGKLVTSFGVMKTWNHTWNVPKDFKKGRGYTLKLTGDGESAESKPFRVKARTPFLLKISPIIVIAAIIPFLDGKSSSSDELPGAPMPD